MLSKRTDRTKLVKGCP